jgi:hypothetical protein
MRVVPTFHTVKTPVNFVDVRLSEGEARNLMQVIENMVEHNSIRPSMFISAGTRDLAHEIKKALGNA